MMNRELAAAFGHLPPDPTMVKEAVCREMFSKLAAENGVDLSRLPDAEVANEYAAFLREIKTAEVMDAKVAEAQRQGRTFAHVAMSVLMGKVAASPMHAEYLRALGQVQAPQMGAVSQKITPQFLEGLVQQGHLTAEEALEVAGKVNMDPDIASGVKGRLHKAWGTSGAMSAPEARTAFTESLKGRTNPLTLEELLTHGGGAPKAEGLLSKLSPVGLGEAVSKGQWGRAAGKVAPIGAALLAGKWLLNRKRENQLAGQQSMQSPAMGMAGV